MNAPLKHSGITTTVPVEIDARLAFMARAGVYHDLVVLGELDLDEAFDGLVPVFNQIMGYDCCPTCGAAPCVNPSFCAACLNLDKRRGR